MCAVSAGIFTTNRHCHTVTLSPFPRQPVWPRTTAHPLQAMCFMHSLISRLPGVQAGHQSSAPMPERVRPPPLGCLSHQRWRRDLADGCRAVNSAAAPTKKHRQKQQQQQVSGCVVKVHEAPQTVFHDVDMCTMRVGMTNRLYSLYRHK